MKKLIKGLLVLVLTFSCALGFTSCKKDEKGETSRVTVDINPSIELIVDEDQKVVSVTALNDDGAIIISGEAIVGKTVEDAVKLIVNVSTGYLVKGEVEASPNNVKISVSGDSEYAKKLNDKLVESTKKFLEDSGIKAGVEKVKAMAIEDLRKLVVKYSTYTEEEVAEMFSLGGQNGYIFVLKPRTAPGHRAGQRCSFRSPFRHPSPFPPGSR